MIRVILAATDGSGHAKKAVALASELAAKCKARLVLLHVLLRDAPSTTLRQIAKRRSLTKEQRDLLDNYEAQGIIELAEHFPAWAQCESVLRPPAIIGMRASRFEGMIRAAHPTWPEPGIQGALANFEIRADGTVAPWLTLDRHMKILRSLWEHRPSQRFPEIAVPVMLAPADTGSNPAWTADKRAGIAAAESTLAVSRTHWFAPADHDLHAQFPDRLATHLIDAVNDGFFV